MGTVIVGCWPAGAAAEVLKGRLAKYNSAPKRTQQAIPKSMAAPAPMTHGHGLCFAGAGTGVGVGVTAAGGVTEGVVDMVFSFPFVLEFRFLCANAQRLIPL